MSKSRGAGGTASCRGYRGGAPKPCAAALSPQTSLRVHSTEDEDSPKGYRSPKPATLCGAGRKALFAGNGGQLGVFRQTEAGQPFPSGCSAFLIQMLRNEDKDVCSQNKEKRTGKKRMRKIKGMILNITILFQNKVKNVIKDFLKILILK